MTSRRLIEPLLRTTLVAALLTGLLSPSLACVHLDPSPAHHHALIAEAASHATASSIESTHSADELGANGVVDLSEPPTVIDAPTDPHRFVPGPLSAATQPASWLGDDAEIPALNLELRNACTLDLDYAFAASDDPGDAPERRTLEGHTIQTQVIPEGHWLHLWDGARWLGAAVTTVDGGVMEISPSCDTLEVRFDLPERGPSQFAIHWELDADAPIQIASPSSGSIDLAADTQGAPERWGDAHDRVPLRLVNLCAEAADYAFTSNVDDAPQTSSTLAGHAERRVEVPASWWLRYQILDDTWRGGATTSHAGAVIWLAPNCVDYGVGDGEVVRLGG